MVEQIKSCMDQEDRWGSSSGQVWTCLT